MSDTTVRVRITGDISGLKSARKQAGDELKRIATDGGNASRSIQGIGSVRIDTSSLRAVTKEIKFLEAQAVELRRVLANSLPLSEKAEAVEKDLADIERRMRTLGQVADDTFGKRMIKGLEKFSQRAKSVGQAMTLAVTLPIVGLGAAAIKVAAEFDSLERGLITVMGSAEAAKAEIQKLKEVAKLPGLGLQEAIQGSVRLQAAGMSADEARASLKAFGNALASVGSGKAELDGVILALGQIIAKGKVSAEEINQIAERVPQIRQVMKNAFGTADTEALQKMEIGATEFVAKVSAELNRLPTVTGGIRNDWENMLDDMKLALLDLGKTLVPIATDISEKLKELLSWWTKQTPEMQSFYSKMLLIAAAAGPVVYGIGSIASAVTALATVMTAFNLTLAATAAWFALIAVGAGLIAVTANEGFKAMQARRKAASDRKQADINAKQPLQRGQPTRRDVAADMGLSKEFEAGSTTTEQDKEINASYKRRYSAWLKRNQSLAASGKSQYYQAPAPTSAGYSGPKAPSKDELAARERMREIEKRNADEITALKMERNDEIAKAKGPMEKRAIWADYDDKIKKKRSELDEKKDKLAQQSKENAIKNSRDEARAWMDGYATVLDAAGKTFDAQRIMAYKSLYDEMDQLDELAKKGEDVRERMIAATAKYYAEVEKIGTQQKAKDRKDKEDEYNALLDRQDLLQNAANDVERIIHGELVTRMKKLDQEGEAEKRRAAETTKDEKERQAVFATIDAKVGQQKRDLINEEIKANTELINQENEKRRSAVGWVSSTDVWKNAMASGSRLGVAPDVKPAMQTFTADEGVTLAKMLQTLTSMLGHNKNTAESLRRGLRSTV